MSLGSAYQDTVVFSVLKINYVDLPSIPREQIGSTGLSSCSWNNILVNFNNEKLRLVTDALTPSKFGYKMNKAIRSSMRVILILSIMASSCTIEESGELSPAVSNPEVVIPVKATNLLLERGGSTTINGEILERSDCLRPYNLGSLKIEIRDLSKKASDEVLTFYPSSRIFGKKIKIDRRKKFAINVVHEPKNLVIFSKSVHFKKYNDISIKLDCRT